MSQDQQLDAIRRSEMFSKYPHHELVNGIVKISPMSWNSSLGWFQKPETCCNFEKHLDSSSRLWIQKMNYANQP